MTDATPQTLAMPYPWQGELWDDIVQQHKQLRLPHALLLTGPAEVGKSQFARALAQRIICREPVGGYACGTCKSCKLIAAESFPDLKRVTPEEEGKAIKIDQIRKLCDFMAKTAQQGGWKVALIEPAEAMNVNAANALLKTLEEPTDNTLLILVCHQLSRVPATIRSRCQMLSYPVPDQGASRDWLARVSSGDKNPEWLLQQAGGRPLQALKLVESDLLEQRENFYQLLEQLTEHSLSAVVAAEKCYRQPAQERLDWLMLRVQDAIRSQPGAASTRTWFQLLDRVSAARRELESASNPNLQLLWESLLMDWQVMTAR
ncbi:DNA polymerase III subunit delta' [Porticoccus sp. W117]|uniref:DNA polymerase III subunit delta' n=1 Tax=Porticoccus sp. W117 TaxID=3054777 RepID=UPI00259A4F66|nr:DNA polymerase III subunit delta' [Porticoccus sp. W117]MDM3872266.1 DNA polymerase III subunit delta' [Porticoccus sp. W117]